VGFGTLYLSLSLSLLGLVRAWDAEVLLHLMLLLFLSIRCGLHLSEVRHYIALQGASSWRLHTLLERQYGAPCFHPRPICIEWERECVCERNKEREKERLRKRERGGEIDR
jgi:hypothetical protein